MATLITPTAGVTYKFKFQPGYEEFDGVYKVVKIMTYEEYLEDGHDILQDFFTPNHKDEAELNKVINDVRLSKILKLVNPDDLEEDDPRFAPMYFLEENPDHNVKKYYSLGIVAMLGITEEPDDLDSAAAMLVEQFQAVMGVAPEPHFVTINEKWMTRPEYEELLEQRDKDRLKFINYFSENNKLRKRNDELITRNLAYEKIIKKQDTYIKKLKKEFGVEDV